MSTIQERTPRPEIIEKDRIRIIELRVKTLAAPLHSERRHILHEEFLQTCSAAAE